MSKHLKETKKIKINNKRILFNFKKDFKHLDLIKKLF